MKLNYFVLCDVAATLEGGKNVLMGIFDKVILSVYPTVDMPVPYSKFFVAFQTNKAADSNELDAKFLMLSPSGKEVANAVIKNAASLEKKMNQYVELSGMPFTEIGKYIARVEIGKDVFETDLNVEVSA